MTFFHKMEIDIFFTKWTFFRKAARFGCHHFGVTQYYDVKL